MTSLPNSVTPVEHPDTVQDAAASPDKEMPYAELGLKPEEYADIKRLLGRRPTNAELAMYSVMWSEHCSYKSSKIHLKQFGQKVTPQMREHLLVGMGENAGVVDLQGGKPQPPLLRGALPGRGHRCGRYCARHYLYGCPPGGGYGPAAFWCG